MRTIVIGDVHGMREELELLLARVELTDSDHIVFVGDLLDKGPDSPGVVKFVRELSQTHDLMVVEGNHEDIHSRFRKNLTERPKVAEEMSANRPELSSITEALSHADKVFLDSVVPFHRIEKHGILVVHAGIPANMDWFPATIEEAASLKGSKKKSLSQILRVRDVSRETGSFLPLGEAGENDPFWAEVYDGRFGHVVFGHSPCREVMRFQHATGIDTGAVFGGLLTAMVIEEDGGQEFVSVKGRGFSDPISWR